MNFGAATNPHLAAEAGTALRRIEMNNSWGLIRV
jgi:hypothetical protein